MDPRRFDALVRSLAGARSRRGVLGGIAAFAVGLAGARSAGAQVTQVQCGNQFCASNPGGCNPGCVCCVYGNGNSRCRPPGTCSPGTEVGGPCAGKVDGASCGTGLVCTGGQCLGNGLCTSGDSFCQGGGGPDDPCFAASTCGFDRKCATTPEGGTTCVFVPDASSFCSGGGCDSSADCADGFVCLPAGATPCCLDQPTGTCFPVCQDTSEARAVVPSSGGGLFWGTE